MGFFDDIFMKIFGGSKQESQQTQQAQSSGYSQSQAQSSQAGLSTQANVNPFTAGLQDPFSSALAGLLSGGIPKSGLTAAPMASGEASVLASLLPQTGPDTARAGYLNDVLSGRYLAGNPFLEQFITAAQRPTLQGLEETLARTLPGKFTLAGQTVDRGGAGKGSSAFDRAAALATGQTANALGDIATKIAYPAYATEREAQQQAVGLSQAEVDTTVKNLQAQALPRMIQELGIERGMDEFKTRLASLLDLLKTIGGVTAPTLATTSITSGGSQSKSQAQEQSTSFGQGTSSGVSYKGAVESFIPKPNAPK